MIKERSAHVSSSSSQPLVIGSEELARDIGPSWPLDRFIGKLSSRDSCGIEEG